MYDIRDPQTPLEKAYFIDKMIKAKILSQIQVTSLENSKQYLTHLKDAKYKGIKNKFPEWEEEL